MSSKLPSEQPAVAAPVADLTALAPVRFLAALTGVRAVAALWVVGYHLLPEMEVLAAPWLFQVYSAVMATGYLGVDLFFILSGFILSLNYGERFAGQGREAPSLWQFLGARLARIYPVHLFTLLMLVPATLAMEHLGLIPDPVRFSGWAFAENLLLIHGWHLNLYERLTWNTPAWSISLEWLAYLFFPVLAVFMFRQRGRMRGYGQLLILSALLPLAMWSSGRLFGFGTLDSFVRIGIEFVLGMLLYDFYLGARRPALGWGRLTGLAVTAVLLGSLAFWFTGYDNFAYTLVIFFPLIVLGLAHRGHVIGNLLGGRWPVYLGLLSYSLYMTHNIWLMVAKALLNTQDFVQASVVVKVVVGLTYFVPCLLIAAIAYHFVEEPARRFITRQMRRSSGRVSH